MSAINEHHDTAMDFAHFALLERARGNTEEAAALFEKALENELAAIQDMEARGSFAEPTYSVLHRSAGTLAMDCKQYRLAEQLAAKGLARAEHPEIAQELRDLLEQVNFHRRLELKGVELSEAEMQLSLSGPEVGSGTAPLSDLTRIVGNVEDFIYRITEWTRDLPFRERGRLPKDIKDNYRTFASVPRSGSFAISLKLGSPIGQLSSSGMSETSKIINEFMDIIELAYSSNIMKMEARVPDPAYLRKFRELAEDIAPDGERIHQVGFTAIRKGNTRSVLFTRSAPLLPMPPVEESDTSEIVEISGVLRYADASGKKNQIRVVNDDARKQHRVEVPTGMMNDIVRPMWDAKVTVRGVRKGNSKDITLQDIWESGSEEPGTREAPAGVTPMPLI